MPFKNTLLLCLCFCLPTLAFAQTSATSTSTVSNSVGTGTTNETIFISSLAIGPAQIGIGDRATCSTSGPVPTLSNCSLPGTPFVVVSGSTNINIHTHRQSAVASVPVVGSATSVTFGPWVPIGSGLGIALLAMLTLLRRKG